jgi:hypothetical protein
MLDFHMGAAFARHQNLAGRIELNSRALVVALDGDVRVRKYREGQRAPVSQFGHHAGGPFRIARRK